MFIKWEVVKRKALGRLILDLFMITFAVISMLLITFDYTYLRMRDLYLSYLPKVAATYDPVKGIEAHRFTQDYVNKADYLFRQYYKLEPAERQQRQQELIKLSNQMIEEDPFQRAHKSGDLERIKEKMRHFTGERDRSKVAFVAFWNLNETNLAGHEAFFNAQIAPIMRANFWRRIDTHGRYVDYFIFIDLIFIIVFLTEFLISWRLAVKRKGPDQKILFPMYHWYDLISCIPVQELRFLRLFRILSVYVRLVRSDILTFGEGPIHRLVNRYRAIITEEISDQVAVKILSDVQEKVKLGVHRTVVEETLRPNKEAIKQVLIDSIRKFENRLVTTKRDEWVLFLAELVEDSIKDTEEYQKWSRMPLVSGQVERLFSRRNILATVDQTFANLTESLREALLSDAGEAFLDGLLDDIFEEVILISREEMIQSLLTSINLHLLEEFKKGSTKVKKWKADEQAAERRSTKPLPANPGIP